MSSKHSGRAQRGEVKRRLEGGGAREIMTYNIHLAYCRKVRLCGFDARHCQGWHSTNGLPSRRYVPVDNIRGKESDPVAQARGAEKGCLGHEQVCIGPFLKLCMTISQRLSLCEVTALALMLLSSTRFSMGHSTGNHDDLF